MHLRCQDTECVGNDLPAGATGDARCYFCERPLADAAGNVLAVGDAPLVDGSPPESFNALMDALRDEGIEVRVVEMSAVRVEGGALLLSALAEDGELLSAEVCDGERAREVEHVMSLMAS